MSAKSARSALAPLLALTASLALALGLLEVVLRTTHLFGAHVSWSEPDPLLRFRYAPNAPYWNRLEGGHSSGFINRYGWRDVNWSEQKAPGTLRVAVLGDSYVEAFQVESDQTFVKVAERALSTGGLHAELMNFGESGFTQSEEYLVARDHALRFKPDLFVLFFFPYNDIRDIDKDLSPDQHPFFTVNDEGALVLDTSFANTTNYKLRQLINPIKRHSALVSLVVERLTARSGASASASKAAPADPAAAPAPPLPPAPAPALRGYLTLETAHPDPRYLKAFEINKRLIAEIAHLVGPDHLLLVTMESPGWQPEEEVAIKEQDPTFDPFFFGRSLEELTQREHIYHMALEPVLRADWVAHHRPLHWGHYNYAGHEVVGAALAKRIEEITGGSRRQ